MVAMPTQKLNEHVLRTENGVEDGQAVVIVHTHCGGKAMGFDRDFALFMLFKHDECDYMKQLRAETLGGPQPESTLEVAINAAIRLLDSAPMVGKLADVDGEVDRIMKAYPNMDRLALKRTIIWRLQEISRGSPHTAALLWDLFKKGEDR